MIEGGARAQAARRLGHDACGDRQPLAVADDYDIGDDPHRHAERERVCRDTVYSRAAQSIFIMRRQATRRTSSRCAGFRTSSVLHQSDRPHAEHHRRAFDMLMVCHHPACPSPRTSPSPAASAGRRGGGYCTTSARSRSSVTAVAMGRVEVPIRTWQTAHKMKCSAGGWRRKGTTTICARCHIAIHDQPGDRAGAVEMSARSRPASYDLVL